MESLVLASAGGLVGLGLAHGGVALLLRLAPANLPRLDQVGLDGGVLLFAAGLVVAVTLIFGMAPAMRLMRSAGNGSLAQRAGGDRAVAGRRTNRWTRSSLLVAEVALSVMLLLGAGLLLRTFVELHAVELGFEQEGLFRFAIARQERFEETPDDNVRFFESLEERLEQVPGVLGVGSVYGSPLGYNSIGTKVTYLDRPVPPPGQEAGAALRIVTPGYFETLQVPLLMGRHFKPGDRIDAQHVAIVSQSLVRDIYPDKSPIGEQLDLSVSFNYPNGDETRTIVGVVGDIRSVGVDADLYPEIYVPQGQMGSDYLTVMVRGAPGVETAALMTSVRAVVSEVDPELPLRNLETMPIVVQREISPTRFYLLLLGVFAGVAVTLAAIGLYGVLAYVVSRRRREIAVRIAIGAEKGAVTRLVVAQGLRPAAVGLGLGLVGSLIVSRALGSLLYGVGPYDVVSMVAAVSVTGIVTTLAILIPALRASRIDPAAALQEG